MIIEKIPDEKGCISLYDAERTLCDLIKDKNKIDSQIFSDAINMYFSNKKIDPRKRIKYARPLKVEAPVRNDIEVIV